VCVSAACNTQTCIYNAQPTLTQDRADCNIKLQNDAIMYCYTTLS